MDRDILRLAVSSCLLGEATRYDGGSRPEPAVTEDLARRPDVALLPLCPEVGVGMPVPREPVDLVGDPATPRMLGVTSRTDWTERMNAWAREQAAALAAAGVAGAVLKARSPSCGHGTTPVYPRLGDDPERAVNGDGLFVLALHAALPGLPVADEETLRDPRRREAFLAAARAYRDRRRAGGGAGA